MPEVTYIAADATRVIVDAEVGDSVMSAALAAGLDGIVGECGGNAMCATCHVYVESGGGSLQDLLEFEDEMLNSTISPRRENSRLSCQLILSEADDGLVVRLPEAQV